MRDKDKRVNSLADLGKLNIGAGKTNPAPHPQRLQGSHDGGTPRISARVRRKERAGRAPYNFVPLDAAPWPAVDPPLSHAEFGNDGEAHSGHIDIDLTALTDFYTRGMWPLGSGKDPKDQVEPFAVDGKLRLPGSSIRGMVRTLVEILGKAPLAPVNDDQLFFRAVAASDRPDNRFFEPQAVAYKARIVKGEGRMAQLSVQVGYLYGSREQWTIRPAKRHEDRQWYRYTTAQTWKRQPVTFWSESQWATLGTGRPGFLICSGGMQKKRRQWVIEEEDPQAQPVTIPTGDVEAYQDGGSTREIRKAGFEYSNASKGEPCFYVHWKDVDGNDHISFGHTPYFRLPYRNTVRKAVPPENDRRSPRAAEWDLAQAIFGRVTGDKDATDVNSWKGRVAFEDGLLVEAPAPAVRERPVTLVLNAPKPTTYQHYLVQRSDELKESIQWDARKPTVRGHKLYWHRPGAPLKPGTDKEDVSTTFRPGRQGAKFRARIRFHNLRPIELGVLLTALDLPQECAHRFGMAKPHGFGSFRVHVKDVCTINPAKRYASFFSDAASLATGKSAVSGSVWKAAFARWYTNSDTPDLWAVPRLRELKALLTFDHLPENWAAMTRYLEFGRINGKSYNEYLEVGIESGCTESQKRRPLPPATQVLEAGPAIPKDPRPPFEVDSGSGQRGSDRLGKTPYRR